MTSCSCSCRILCSNVRGLVGNLSDLTVASSRYDKLLCSETMVSDMRHVSDLLVPGLVALYCYVWARCLGSEGWLNTYEIFRYGTFLQPKFEWGCCKMIVFNICGVQQIFRVFGLYRNRDLNYLVFDCLLTSINGCSSYLFIYFFWLRMCVPLSYL